MNKTDSRVQNSKRNSDDLNLQIYKTYAALFYHNKQKAAEAFIANAHIEISQIVNETNCIGNSNSIQGTHPALIKAVQELEKWIIEEMLDLERRKKAELIYIQNEYEIEIKKLEKQKEEYNINYTGKAPNSTYEKNRTGKYDRNYYSVNQPASRKLRRRPNDLSNNDRKKTSDNYNSIMNKSQSEASDLIDEDIFKIVNALRLKKGIINSGNSSEIIKNNNTNTYVNGGKLYINRKCFEKGQHVILESERSSKIDGKITLISENEVIVKSNKDNSTYYINLESLILKTHVLKRKS